MESVNVRNLEQIQEADGRLGGGRLATLVLAALGGSAVVIAGITMAARSGPAASSTVDPLAALVAEAQAQEQERVGPEHLDRQDASFPGILSDGAHSTTALAVVKDAQGRLVEQPAGSGEADATPPPATDQLPVVPLPVGSLLQATPVTTEPKDRLTAMAARVASGSDGGELAPLGNDGGIQLQVASFKAQADADQLVEQLRRRGHSAFRQAAQVRGRGLWHRVRIGPFASRYEANLYKKKFEASERMAPFVVDPAQVRRAEEIRDAKAAVRARREAGGGD